MFRPVTLMLHRLQMFYTLHGYTMFEYHSLSIREAYEGDGQGIGDRMRLVFGPYWLVHFAFPAVSVGEWGTPLVTVVFQVISSAPFSDWFHDIFADFEMCLKHKVKGRDCGGVCETGLFLLTSALGLR